MGSNVTGYQGKTNAYLSFWKIIRIDRNFKIKSASNQGIKLEGLCEDYNFQH
jgi:hypothetical protein